MKFRISLSQEQMEWISNSPTCPPELKNLVDLALFKVGKGMVKPAYEIKVKSMQDLPLEKRYLKALWYLERDMPIPPELIESYNEYRYLNDLMSQEEEAAYAELNAL